MKNQKVLIAAAALIVLIAVRAGVYFTARPATVAGAKAITVTVVHADGSAKELRYPPDADYLGPVLLTEGLVEGEEGPYGLTINTVDGEKADWNENQSYWALYVGEDYAATGADSTPVKDGDTFKLVYTIG